jgi:hypothetical protein
VKEKREKKLNEMKKELLFEKMKKSLFMSRVMREKEGKLFDQFKNNEKKIFCLKSYRE